MNALDLIKNIDAVNIDLECLSNKPNMIGFYDKITSSFNKAEVRASPTARGLLITHSSKNIEDIMGYSPEELKGTYIQDYRATSLNFLKLSKMIRLLDRGETIIKTSSIRHKDGSIVETRSMIFKDVRDYIEFVWRVEDEFDLG